MILEECAVLDDDSPQEVGRAHQGSTSLLVWIGEPNDSCGRSSSNTQPAAERSMIHPTVIFNVRRIPLFSRKS